jgi:hypothetical protein
MNASKFTPRGTPGRWTPIPLALALIFVALPPSPSDAAQEMRNASQPAGTELSPTLGPNTFYEEGGRLFLGVDTQAARNTKTGDILPLGFAVANLGKSPVAFNRESFVLVAENGSRFPLVSMKEFRGGYNRSRVDHRLGDALSGMMKARFENDRFVAWRLFPFTGEFSNASGSVELGRWFWTQNYLYFRVPAEARQGNLTLLIDSGDESPSVVTLAL